MNVYALIETEGQHKTVLGVFSKPELKEGVLKSYYGECATSFYDDVRDSGIEWTMVVTHPTGQATLTMMDFVIDEI
jgi:hypothetical protein